MSKEVLVCPNCGAYVMGGDRYCPRCDHPLDQPPPLRPDDLSDIAPAGPGSDSESDAGRDRADLTTTEQPPVPARAGASAPPDEIPDLLDLPDAPGPGSGQDDQTPDDGGLPDDGDTHDDATAISLSERSDSALPPHDAPERQELREGLAQAAAALDADPSEMPTSQFARVDAAPITPPPFAPAAPPDVPLPGAESGITEIPRREPPARPVSIIPPAPYTPPPPVLVAPPYYGYAAQPAMPDAAAYLQQRIQAYRRGGYKLVVSGPYEATLSYGKRLGVGGWMLALLTVIGFFWYLLLLAVSGFQAEQAYLYIEPDGRVYEDGPGAAHVRRSRARTGRRWSLFGLAIFIICLLLALALAAVGGIMLSQDRYQAALREAYPAVTLFEEHFSTDRADPDDVQTAKDGAVAFAILAGIAVVGVWGGATLWVIGTVHAGAYRAHVPPLPGYA